jgi:hypothetical protein
LSFCLSPGGEKIFRDFNDIKSQSGGNGYRRLHLPGLRWRISVAPAKHAPVLEIRILGKKCVHGWMTSRALKVRLVSDPLRSKNELPEILH